MMSTQVHGKIWIRSASIVAILFGLLTIREGGDVLFWSETARRAAGNYVPFVLWFNFLSGFAYIVAGLGLWLRRHWVAGFTFGITAAILAVFVAFGFLIAGGGAYEMRTVVAMCLRSTVWIAIAAIAYWFLWRPRKRDSL